MEKLHSLETYKPDQLSLDPKYRNHFITHLHYLRNHPDTKRTTVSKEPATAFAYNLYAYLNAVNVPERLHWLILVMNGFDNPSQFTPSCNELLIPDLSLVEEIYAMYNG